MKKFVLVLIMALLSVTVLFAGPVQNDSLIFIYKTDVAPVIDGVLDSAEWKSAQPIALSVLDKAGDAEFLSGESIDYSAWMRIMWDSENIYIFADMLDDQTVSAADEGYSPDKLELHFDGDNSDGYTKAAALDTVTGIPYAAGWMGWMWGKRATVYDSINDVQIMIELGVDTLGLANVGWGFNMKRNKPGFDFSGAEVVSHINDNEDGYAWEIKIPWTALNLDPATIVPGYELGFNPTTNDCDFSVADTAGALIKRHYSFVETNNQSWIYPGSFPTLQLRDEPAKWEARSQKTYLAPVVDGVVDSIWTYAISKSVSSMLMSYDTTYVKDNFDTRAWMKTMWDDDNLYLLFNVIDDIVLTWDYGYGKKSDEIELYFNGDNLPGLTKAEALDTVTGIPYAAGWMGWMWSWGETVYDSINDFQIQQYIGNDTLYNANQGWGMNMRRNKLASDYWTAAGMQSAVVVNEDEMGYVVEYSIPWEALNIADLVKSGHKIGFNAEVVDGDDDIVNGAGEIRRKKYSWYDNNNASWICPAKLGTIELVDTTAGIVAIDNGNDVEVPRQYALEQNYPNPFNPTTTINYHVAENAKVSLEIYNILGQKIQTLASGFHRTGEYSAIWNAKNMAGQMVPTGIYFYKINISNGSNVHTEMRKMMLLK